MIDTSSWPEPVETRRSFHDPVTSESVTLTKSLPLEVSMRTSSDEFRPRMKTSSMAGAHIDFQAVGVDAAVPALHPQDVVAAAELDVDAVGHVDVDKVADLAVVVDVGLAEALDADPPVGPLVDADVLNVAEAVRGFVI